MDTSKEYGEMCYSAKEIQELWEVKDGDFHTTEIDLDYPQPLVLTVHDEIDIESINRFPVWLPRQDQLQEMVEEEITGELLERFYDFYITSPCNCSSFEIMWLSFVMEQKYNKTWDGKDWR